MDAIARSVGYHYLPIRIIRAILSEQCNTNIVSMPEEEVHDLDHR